MENTGQIYAYDSDARRLTDTIPRADAPRWRNLQIRTPAKPDALKGLDGRMDVVFVDAPCSGTRSWRRHPTPSGGSRPRPWSAAPPNRTWCSDQATAFVKPGGRLVYVTCSVLPAEDEDRVAAFRERHPEFATRPATDGPDARPLADAGGLSAPFAPHLRHATASSSRCWRNPPTEPHDRDRSTNASSSSISAAR
jgi:16S rRNA (cytosine967-C5)-methyltransferase